VVFVAQSFLYLRRHNIWQNLLCYFPKASNLPWFPFV